MSESDFHIHQAEYLPPDRLQEVNSEHPEQDIIVKKLLGQGAKLLSGPRGCGKTTLMLKAYHQAKTCDDTDRVLAIYVNFKNTIMLEPFYKTSSRASHIFKSWMCSVIATEIEKKFKDSAETIDQGKIFFSRANKTIKDLQRGIVSDDSDSLITEDELIEFLEDLVEMLSYKRAVILIDDAAHAFVDDQQRDFFDFFRKIKTRKISPKAAIYPGVTKFSPTFQIGHDAEEVYAWIKPHDEKYINFMLSVLSKWMPAEFEILQKHRSEEIKLLAYSAFGIPRSLLRMAMTIVQELDGELTAENIPSAKDFFNQISQSVDSSLKLFETLKSKVPFYSNFISAGVLFLNNSVDLIKVYNQDKELDSQSRRIAFQEKEVTSEVRRMIEMLEYAGLILTSETISRGEKGIFQTYDIHLGLLVDRNAIAPSKAKSASRFSEALRTRHAHEFTRTSVVKLINGTPESILKYSMSQCPQCSTPRLNEKSKFCHICGKALKEQSLYLELLDKEIDVIGISDKMLRRMKEGSTIRKVSDILSEDGKSQLMSIGYVKEVRATWIYQLAEEYVFG